MTEAGFFDLLSFLLGAGSAGEVGVTDTMSVQRYVQDGILFTVNSVAPAPQAGTGSYAVLAGSDLDVRGWGSIAYTIRAADAALLWTVYAGNESDFSDEVIVQAEEEIASGAVDFYVATPPPFGYYRIKIKNSTATVSTATARGLAK